jgi:hypothetical protein
VYKNTTHSLYINWIVHPERGEWMLNMHLYV